MKSQDPASTPCCHRLKNKSAVLVSCAIGQKVGQGVVRLIKDASQMDRVKPGDVLVTDMTDPTGSR